MNRKRLFTVIPCLALCINLVSSSGVLALTSGISSSTNNIYKERFLSLYNDLKDPSNGYFSKDGIPYHCIETLMCEAPDQGHESTSETASYYVWLEAMKGKFSGDFKGLEEAWNVIDKYYIPTEKDQPGQTSYNASSPATYAPEYPLPTSYPSELQFNTKVGSDPLFNELKTTYGNPYVYGMHWLIDGDNFYGYGQRGDGKSAPTYINTFQRGPQESTWETVPHPSWEEFKWGGQNGFLDLFTGDKSYSKQWRYTNAPDADARTIQAMYYAKKWADEDNVNIDPLVEKSSKMGDYLRYSMFDKYFMNIGAEGISPATERNSEHGLMSWYYAWGGAIPSSGNWCWRIGCSHSHGGYQNPLTAYVLSTDKDFIPKSPTAKSDWEFSLKRQIEFYNWLQSSEGAIAGGCTNSLNGSYDKYPAGTSTFYGMAYEKNPVYLDPGSNTWFGFQAWSMQRVAQYYYETGDTRVKDLLDKWAKWAVSSVKLNDDETFEIPNKLDWQGQPDTWTGTKSDNKNLHVTIQSYGTDLGIAGSLSNALIQYAAATKKYSPSEDYTSSLNTAKELLDRMWTLYRDDKGVAAPEERADYLRFFEKNVYLPHAVTLGDGTVVTPDENGYVSFLDLRPQYKNDPMIQEIYNAQKEGRTPVFTYHRFWAQCDIALALGSMSILFPDEGGETPPQSDIKCKITTPKNNTTYDFTSGVKDILYTAEASTDNGNIKSVEFYVDGKLIKTDNKAPYRFNYKPDSTGMDADGNKKLTLKAVAITDKGEKKASDTVTVNIKFKSVPAPAPVINITSPTKNQEFDATDGLKKITVSAAATVASGKIDKINIYADGNLIGYQYDDECTAYYEIPDKYGPEPDGKINVKFTAEAITDLGKSAKSDEVNAIIKLPLEPETPPIVEGDIAISVNRNTNATTNTISNSYILTNNGQTSYDLSKLKIKYYFTDEGYNNINTHCDNAGMQLKVSPWYENLTSSVKMNIVKVPGNINGADSCVELTFSNNAALSPGAQLTIGTRMYTSDWKTFNQTNDYSFDNDSNVVIEYNSIVVHGVDIK